MTENTSTGDLVLSIVTTQGNRSDVTTSSPLGDGKIMGISEDPSFREKKPGATDNAGCLCSK